jgi:hypothetical protein
MNLTKRNAAVLAFVATMFSAAGLISQTTATTKTPFAYLTNQCGGCAFVGRGLPRAVLAQPLLRREILQQLLHSLIQILLFLFLIRVLIKRSNRKSGMRIQLNLLKNNLLQISNRK